jgi:hypothetical protein
VVDEAKVSDWARNGFRWMDRDTKEWHTQDPQTANTALRAERYVAIDVDDYGDNTGAADLAALEERLGPLPATPSSTSRGPSDPSRQHFLALPPGMEDVELVTEIGKSIQIVQRHHRYSVVWPSVHPETGQAYVWYDAEGEPMDWPPSLDEFEYLPEAWIEYLRAPEHRYTSEQYDGPQVEAATKTEERCLAAIARELDELPRPWHEGAGWRSTMFRLACWMHRMVNSAAYAVTEEQGLQIILDHCPTDSEWTVGHLMEQWESAKQSSVGQFADLPEEDRPPLLLPHEALARMSPDLFELANRAPSSETEGAHWDLRQRIMVAAFAEGHDDVVAASIAWHSPFAGLYLRNDMHGETKLWREVETARSKVGTETGSAVEAAPASERPPLEAERVDLLSLEERAFLAGEGGHWWGSRYLEWAASRVPVFNGPYHRMNRWQILSLIVGPFGFIPKKDGPMGLNLFSLILGNTTTGKSQSKKLAKSVIKACYPFDDPNIGGDATANALVEKLIERDGKPSWFNADEAHGLFKELAGAGWRGSLMEKWTDLYEGEVPTILRAMKKDVSGVHAKAHFVMHLMGTEAGMVEVLDRHMWDSGFLARFIWAIGEPNKLDPRTLDVDEVDDYEDVQKSYDRFPAQWAAEFATVTRDMNPKEPRPVRLSLDAKRRYKQFQDLLPDIYEGHKFESMLAPTLNRFNDTVRKCAALVALSEGSFEISPRHLLIALEQAEEWLANAMDMVRRTTETGFARQVSRIEAFVAASAKGQVRREQVYRHMAPAFEKFDVDRYLQQLIAEGRVALEQAMDGGQIVKIKTEGALAA